MNRQQQDLCETIVETENEIRKKEKAVAHMRTVLSSTLTSREGTKEVVAYIDELRAKTKKRKVNVSK